MALWSKKLKRFFIRRPGAKDASVSDHFFHFVGARPDGSSVRFEFDDRNRKRVFMDGRFVEFEFDVFEVVVYDPFILILLSIPNRLSADIVRNLYCFQGGKQLWQVENLNDKYPDRGNLPFVGIHVTDDGLLIGTDFCGRRYGIDMANGAITQQLSSVK